MKVGERNEGCDTGGRNGNAARRGNGRAPETNGRDRRQADPLAYYEALLLLWNERVHYRARVQERGDHSIFPGAASLQLGPHRPHWRRLHYSSRTAARTGLDRPSYRHGTIDRYRWSHQATRAPHWQRDVHA